MPQAGAGRGDLDDVRVSAGTHPNQTISASPMKRANKPKELFEYFVIADSKARGRICNTSFSS